MSSKRLVVCPYNEAHKVKESRYQLHISKCRENQDDKDEKFICPFNATHVMTKPERTYHIQHCPDRATVDRKLSHSNKGFEPLVKEAPQGAIIEPPPKSKPANRRKLYQELHRVAEKEPEHPQASSQTTVPKAPKQPDTKRFEFKSILMLNKILQGYYVDDEIWSMVKENLHCDNYQDTILPKVFIKVLNMFKIKIVKCQKYEVLQESEGLIFCNSIQFIYIKRCGEDKYLLTYDDDDSYKLLKDLEYQGKLLLQRGYSSYKVFNVPPSSLVFKEIENIKDNEKSPVLRNVIMFISAMASVIRTFFFFYILVFCYVSIVEGALEDVCDLDSYCDCMYGPTAITAILALIWLILYNIYVYIWPPKASAVLEIILSEFKNFQENYYDSKNLEGRVDVAVAASEKMVIKYKNLEELVKSL